MEWSEASQDAWTEEMLRRKHVPLNRYREGDIEKVVRRLVKGGVDRPTVDQVLCVLPPPIVHEYRLSYERLCLRKENEAKLAVIVTRVSHPRQ